MEPPDQPMGTITAATTAAGSCATSAVWPTPARRCGGRSPSPSTCGTGCRRHRGRATGGRGHRAAVLARDGGALRRSHRRARSCTARSACGTRRACSSGPGTPTCCAGSSNPPGTGRTSRSRRGSGIPRSTPSSGGRLPRLPRPAGRAARPRLDHEAGRRRDGAPAAGVRRGVRAISPARSSGGRSPRPTRGRPPPARPGRRSPGRPAAPATAPLEAAVPARHTGSPGPRRARPRRR